MTQLDKQTIDSQYTATLNSQGIVEVYWNTEVLEISVDHLKSLRSRLKELGNGSKMLLFLYSKEFAPISAEAREYVAAHESSEYTLANAIKIDTLPKKIIFNFILRFYSPSVPTKAFSTKEEAFEWLLSVKKDLDLQK